MQPPDHDLEAQDTLARERALDPERSIILQAPAGSGKTTVLTRRFLRLLAGVDEPEEILAVTFTRKAAAEMRVRVMNALAGRDPGDSDPDGRLAALARAARERSVSRGWDLESNPGRLRIQTIDALNRALASQLPVAARATVGLQLADRPDSFYRQAARRTLIDAEEEPHLRRDLEWLLERLDNDPARAERLLTAMLAVRAHWLPLILGETAQDLPARVIASLASILDDRLTLAHATIPRPLIEQGVGIARTVARNLAGPSGMPLRTGAATLADWRGMAAFAFTERGEWRRALTRAEGFPPDDGALKANAFEWLSAMAGVTGARELLCELASLPDASLPEEDREALRSLARLLRLAASELEIVFRDAGRIDHAYVAAAARRALTEEGEPTDLSLRLGQRLRHILVDEFQDTSSEQVELLRSLTAGWQAGDGRSLFVVGDPMQSIYLFRQAEVGLFLKVAERGLGELALERLALTRNFRASGELVDWLNVAFPRIFPEVPDVRSAAISYSPCVAGRADHRGGRVELHRFENGDAGGEGTTTVSIVRRVRAENPARSIAVLVAARPHATAIATALRAARVPVAGVDLVPLSEVPVVRDLAALARALEHLGDRTAWLAVLRAPWCGVGLRELTSLLDRLDESTVWDVINHPDRIARLSEEAQLRLSRTRDALSVALAARREQSPAQLLEAAWMRLGGPAVCASADELRHAERFFQRLAAWSGEPDWSGAHGIADRLGSLFANDMDAAEEAVQIMTIHRAKGLEFDVVILPGLGRAQRNDSEPLLRWLELPGTTGGMDLLVAPISPRGADVEPLNAYLKSLRARRLAHERGRLVYVAATRARRELHLLCDLQSSADGADPQPRAGTLLATLWPAIATHVRTAVAPSREEGAAVAHVSLPLKRLPADWQAPEVACPNPAGSFAVRGEPLPLPEFAWVTPAARWAGRIVHEQLREWAIRKAPPDRERVLDARDAIARRLTQLGLAGSELQRAQARAIEALLALSGDARGRWLYARQHREVASPLEITGILDGQLVNVAVDRSFIDTDGVRWLVDLKIGVHHGANLEEFIASEVARYRPQLERAIALASGLGPEPVRAALYFPLLQVFRELGAEG